MAYISRECVTCTDPTKRCEGKYRGKDEKGKSFSGDMYTCSNSYCQINIERMKTQRKLKLMEENEKEFARMKLQEKHSA